MGLLKKLWKGVKKVVKKIGKGIKKVVGKIGAAIGKLGIIGQIGMMFLMPYAMAGLSSFFGGVGARIATWSANLATSNPIVSKFLGAVHKAGSMVSNAYSTVTTAIGNGVDRVGNFFKGEGFTLSADRASVFGTSASSPVTGTPTVTAESVDLPTSTTTPTGTPTVTSSGSEIVSTNTMPPSSIEQASAFTGEVQQFETDLFSDASYTQSEYASAVADATDVFVTGEQSLLAPKAPVFEATTTFGENVKDYFVKGYEGGIKALKDPGKLAEDTVSSGLVRGGAQRIAYSVMGDPPVQRQHVTTQNLSQELYNNPTGVYNSIDVSLTQQGAPWGAGNLAHYGYIQEGLSDGSDEYARLMQRIS
jgi:hypothetical protein